MKRRLASLALLLAASCASSQQIRKEEVISEGIVFPITMCGKHGTIVSSNDEPGKKMYCEQIEPTGSHLPQCICWDEEMIARMREETQQALREYY